MKNDGNLFVQDLNQSLKTESPRSLQQPSDIQFVSESFVEIFTEEEYRIFKKECQQEAKQRKKDKIPPEER